MGINTPAMVTIGQESTGSAIITVDSITDAGATGKGVMKAGTLREAHDALDLGAAATRGAGTSIGDLMPVGAFGVGTASTTRLVDCNASVPGGFYFGFGNGSAVPTRNCPPEAGAFTLTFFVASGNAMTNIICLENNPAGVNAWFGMRSGGQVRWTRVSTSLLPNMPTRKKSEVLLTGLNLTIPTTATNLITLIKDLPKTGDFAPFFDVASGKMVVFNKDATCLFKLNIIGTWGGTSTLRSIEVDFPGTTGNRIIYSRDGTVTTASISMSTFFSVDVGGGLATDGAPITIKSNGSTFIASSILLVAEQVF